MSRLIINNFNEFAQHIGQELGVSDYLTITQEQIDLFADATLDHQWIHVDTERARTESPYKSTIAHGYLNLSVLPYLWGQILEVNNVKMLVNYGIEKLRFNRPVLAGSPAARLAGVARKPPRHRQGGDQGVARNQGQPQNGPRCDGRVSLSFPIAPNGS